jgi:hypothetical protein
MDKYAKIRARILALYWREEWHWHGSGRSLTVHNVKTGEKRHFARVE